VIIYVLYDCIINNGVQDVHIALDSVDMIIVVYWSCRSVEEYVPWVSEVFVCTW
jgi:hypothetical protein